MATVYKLLKEDGEYILLETGDGFIIEPAVYSQSIDETITIVDSFIKITSKILSESITLVDSIARTISRYLSNELVTIVDTIQNVKILLLTLSDEVVEIADTIAKGISYSRTFDELVDIVESFSRQVQYNKSISEVITIVDLSVSFIIGKLFEESIEIVDGLIKLVSRFLTESVSILDAAVSFYKRVRGFMLGLNKNTNTLPGIKSSNIGKNNNTNTNTGTRL